MYTTFCHIEEFGEERYNLLPIMAYCFHHSVIWAPNMSKIELAYQNHKSFFRPEHILELVDQRRIQIMARESWYDKDERSNFQSSDWLDNIDSALRDYAIADKDKPHSQKRVIIASEAKGIETAEKIMGSALKTDQDLVNFIRQQYRGQNIPYRITHFIKKSGFTEDQAIKWILQNMCNNHDAFKLSKAQVPTMGEKSDIFLKYMEYDNVNQFTEDISFKQVSTIVNSLRVILSLGNGRLNQKKFIRLIEDSNYDSIEHDFSVLSKRSSDEAITKDMLVQISSLIRTDIEQNKDKDYLTLFDLVGIAGFCITLISFIISYDIQSTLNLFLSISVVPSLIKLFRINNSMKLNTNLPYLFAFGTTRPSREQIQELYDTIKKILD